MFQELKKVFKVIDKWFMLFAFAAAILGLIVVYSATRSLDGGTRTTIIQFCAFLAGVIGMVVVMALDYESFGHKWTFIYAINIMLLAVVLILGVGEDIGGKSWIRIGPVGLQPSELVKVGFILTFAKHLEKVQDDMNRLIPLLGIILHAGILIGLILLQPDYGTAMVYMFIFICMVFAAGLHYRYFAIAAGGLLVFAPIAWFFVLKPYQKLRFLTFFNPEYDPSGSGYQVLQSKLAIGSGELTGRGLFQGPQTQLNILPAKETDFIFAVIAEELGFIGCIVAICLLFFLIFRCVYIAREAKSDYGKYICVGVAAMFLFQVFENVGMCMGIMPVTGIPLPFFSAGGSSILTSMLAVGLVMNVWVRRKTLNFA